MRCFFFFTSKAKITGHFFLITLKLLKGVLTWEGLYCRYYLPNEQYSIFVRLRPLEGIFQGSVREIQQLLDLLIGHVHI